MAGPSNTANLTEEPINLALRDHQESAQDWRYRALLVELHTWAERFCVRFKLQTPVPAIVVTRLRGRFGHFRPSRNSLGLNFEIAIDEGHAVSEQFWKPLGTLLHELLHLWQHLHGTPPSGSSCNYHNAQYRQKASSLGLIVDRRGYTCYVPEHSPFFDLLNEHGITAPLLPPVEKQLSQLGRLGSSKLKLWECGCPVKVRVAVPNFRARCLACNCLFMKKDPP